MTPPLLVPLEPATTSAAVVVAGVGARPAGLQLEVGGAVRLPLDGGWTEWTHSRGQVWWQRLSVDALDAGRRYPVRLLDGTREVATATLGTLPDRLPRVDERPFTCLLGSCFAHLSDQEGAAGAAAAALPVAARPDLKFLCGDQVYLDAPFPRFLYNVFSEEDLKTELLQTYISTWSQRTDRSGFNELLRSGGAFFTSDDHELWNNAPSPTPIVRNTWWPLGDRGEGWRRVATSLYGIFQASAAAASFRVGQLSFRVVDTRFGRTRDRSRFLPAGELEALAAWIHGLDGPGALVLGQPILVGPAGIRGHLADWALADLGEYGELVRIVQTARHDVLILTGDVHYGRVAGCELPTGASLIEVIASPLALVDPRVGRAWRRPPDVWPAAAVPGAVRTKVWVEERHRCSADHFATLEFATAGSRVRFTVRAWPIPRPGVPPTSTAVFQRDLE